MHQAVNFSGDALDSRNVLYGRHYDDLQEETILDLGKFHGRRARFVVIGHVIDSTAYRVATHQPRIIGFQQFGCSSYIFYPRIEPQVVAIRIKNDWHAVVDGCGHSIGSSGQNRERLQRFPTWSFPPVPYSGKREQLPFSNFKTVWLFEASGLVPLVESVRGN